MHFKALTGNRTRESVVSVLTSDPRSRTRSTHSWDKIKLFTLIAKRSSLKICFQFWNKQILQATNSIDVIMISTKLWWLWEKMKLPMTELEKVDRCKKYRLHLKKKSWCRPVSDSKLSTASVIYETDFLDWKIEIIQCVYELPWNWKDISKVFEWFWTSCQGGRLKADEKTQNNNSLI